jgi:hypothetical protein
LPVQPIKSVNGSTLNGPNRDELKYSTKKRIRNNQSDKWWEQSPKDGQNAGSNKHAAALQMSHSLISAASNYREIQNGRDQHPYCYRQDLMH